MLNSKSIVPIIMHIYLTFCDDESYDTLGGKRQTIRELYHVSFCDCHKCLLQVCTSFHLETATTNHCPCLQEVISPKLSFTESFSEILVFNQPRALLADCHHGNCR